MNDRVKTVCLAVVGLCSVVVGVAQSLAAPAMTCHCFRDREFRAEAPAAADTYLLATMQNRLMALVFELPREALVKAKMAGTSGDRLWLAHWLHRSSRASVEEILRLRQASLPWAEIARRAAADPEELGADLVAALAAKVPEPLLVRQVIWTVLERDLGVDPVPLKSLQGATAKELIFAMSLELATGLSASSAWQKFNDGQSWGQLMADLGQTVESLEQALTTKRQRQIAPVQGSAL